MLLTWAKVSSSPVAGFARTLIVREPNQDQLVVKAISDEVSKPNRILLVKGGRHGKWISWLLILLIFNHYFVLNSY